ncbi:MAG: alpha/beta hydrolase [Lachnospiraceae bacterium]|nr:alpha/beta hydrolase [Lachnospiraceae bacterium]
MLTKEIKLYEDRDDVTLTTYITGKKGEVPGRRPAILICPGGAYFSCSDQEAEPVALRFSAMGYQTFVLRYSTYLEGKGGFPDLFGEMPVKESCLHPTPVREVGKAMLIIREYADEWMVDTDRIAVCGFSAGAHNAAMYSVYWHTPLLTDYFQVSEDCLKPAALILGYTLSDYVYMEEREKSPFDQAFFGASNLALLGSRENSEERLKEVSPCRLVSAKNPPTFLWATAQDQMVPVQHSLRMAHALADHRIPFEMHIFEEGPHGLSLADQSSALARSQIFPDAAKWTALAEAWLKKRFSLELPEKTEF